MSIPNSNTAQVVPNPSQNQVFHYNGLPTLYFNNGLQTPVQYVVEQQNQHINRQPQNQNIQSTNENHENDSSKPLAVKEESELSKDNERNDHSDVFDTKIVQVFKDHNCTNEANGLENISEVPVSNEQRTPQLFAETPSFDETNTPVVHTGSYGARLSTSYNINKGANANSNGAQNSRSERVFISIYPTIFPQSTRDPFNETNKGISKLVASTQDLISNEDLLTINHAQEKEIYIQNDEILKPRYNRFTVKAKIGNIFDLEQADKDSEQVLQTSSNEYKFSSPIVVQDNNNFRSQITNNLVSTIVPYLDEGYELKSVKNTFNDYINDNQLQNSNDSYINVTPRPISQKYLAAITVGLRLVNSNDTDVLNTVDDHEGSDSEVISETIKSPVRERTIVEVQESVPLAITHINDVVVHEWDEGNNKNQHFKITKSQYDQYNDALESSRKIQENMNKQLYLYGSMKNYHEPGNNSNNDKNHNDELKESNDNLEPSENMQTEVEVRPTGDSNERNEYIYQNGFGEKIIQPIIIEKEVPVTKYIDRFIEKKVPYPERVEVIKEVEKQVQVPVHIHSVVEKPVEVTKYVDRPQPYPVEVPHHIPVEVKIPYPVETKVYVDRPVHIPYPVEKFIEKNVLHPVAVPTPVAVPYEVQVPVEKQVLYPVPVEKRVPVPVEVEKRVPYPVPYETKVPVPYPVETRVHVPVEKIVEKPVTITKYVDRPVHIGVPVPHPVAVPVPQPYPVDRIVEKRVPYPVSVDRIVEKKVEVPVQVPVDRIVEKIVEKPVVVTRYVDKPYPVEKRVPYPVEKIVEKRIPYPVQVPVEVKVPYPVEKIVERPVHVPYNMNYPDRYNYPIHLQQRYIPEQHKQGAHLPHVSAATINSQQIQQQQSNNLIPLYVKFKENKDNKINNQQVQSTAWGNLYASTYQYNNHTPGNHKISFNKTPALKKYINYMTNNNPYQYYGPPPVETASDWNKQNYLVEFKLRRTDRTPKVTNLRIEYGGFKPPLVPSTEVDLDGVPVKRDEES